MTHSPGLNSALFAAVETLIGKLASPHPAFTAEDKELMAALRANREVILAELNGIIGTSVGVNETGQRRIDRLVTAIQEICQVD